MSVERDDMVRMDSEGLLAATACDLGVGDADNARTAVRLIRGRLDATYGVGATFTCDGFTCR